MKKFVWNIYRKINKLPKMVCLEACSLCQLNCPDCHMRKNAPDLIVGNGYLKFKDFKKFVDKHPYIESIELSFCGEIFLNPEILEIIKYASIKKVQLTAFNGVNFNTVSDEILEALVKYKFAGLTFSIDGITQATYHKYRKNGDIDKVFENIKKLNTYKDTYRSIFPILQWQYIVFEHNKHEILETQKIKNELKIERIIFKKPWNSDELDIKTKLLIHKAEETFIKDSEILNILKKNNIKLCIQPWKKPQINWNGELLGCCCSTHNSIGANVFKIGLKRALKSKKLAYMKSVLTGESECNDSLQCKHCEFYIEMQRKGRYLSKHDIKIV